MMVFRCTDRLQSVITADWRYTWSSPPGVLRSQLSWLDWCLSVSVWFRMWMKTEGGLFQPVQDTPSVPGQQDSQHVCSVALKYFKIKERLFGCVWAPPWNVITSIYSPAVLQHTFLELWWYSQVHPLKISSIFPPKWQILTVDSGLLESRLHDTSEEM